MNLNDFLQRNSRKLIGVAAISFSLIVGTLLLSNSSNATQLWAAKHQLSVGERITSDDIELVYGSLGERTAKYFSKSARLDGVYIRSAVAPGEIIPVSAMAQGSSSSHPLRDVPLGINKSDLPLNLLPGQFVDVYSIPQKGTNPELIVEKVMITRLDERNSNMSGQILVQISVQPDAVLSLANAIQAGRIVLVRNA